MTATTKRGRETWREWLPFDVPEDPGKMVTREELVLTLFRRGFDVTPDNIRSWEHIGILPQGDRRWHEGATRTLYPEAMIDVVAHLRELQGLGLPLGLIRLQLRRIFALRFIDAVDIPEETREKVRDEAAGGLPDYVLRALATLADFRALITGTPTTWMDLTIGSEGSVAATYSLIPEGDNEWEVANFSEAGPQDHGSTRRVDRDEPIAK